MADSAAENKAMVRRFIEEVFNQGNLAAIGAYVSVDMMSHVGPPGGPSGHASVEQAYRMFKAAFPDWTTVIDDMVAEGNKVVFRGTASGTHEGEFMGIAPTGKRVSLAGVHMMRIDDGKIAEHWAFTDQLAMLRQLGVAPIR